TAEEGTLGATCRSFQPREQQGEERPPAKPSPSSVRGAAGARPPGGLGTAAGRGALLRQAAIAPREDGGTPESPEKALEEGSSQPEPERGPGRSWSGAGSTQGELSAGGTRGDPSDKAEICPWEVAEPQVEKGTAPGKEKLPGKETTKALEKGSKDRESICPWESLDTEQPPAKPHTGSSAAPKAAPGKSQSSEICPWDSQDLKSTDKAEICPWEVAAPQLEKGTAPGREKLPRKEETKALEKGSRERESICPWESLDTEQPPAKPHTGSSAVPK
ncbi:GP179 protein, partial [Emberiza fucata]|nr:GP179 protein [Emberiza fucata]